MSPLFKRLLSYTLGFLAFVTISVSAKADGPMLYFGVHGGKSFAKSDLSADLGPGFPLEINGAGSDGFVSGGHAGLDMVLVKSVGWSPFGGVWASYSIQSTEFDARLGPATISATFGNTWAGGVRLGMMSNGGVKVYGLVGKRWTDLDLAIADLVDQKLNGWDAGLGVQFPITKHIAWGVEGIYTQNSKEEFVSASAGPLGVRHETDVLSVMGRLTINLDTPAAITESLAPVQQAAPAPAPKAKAKK